MSTESSMVPDSSNLKMNILVFSCIENEVNQMHLFRRFDSSIREFSASFIGEAFMILELLKQKKMFNPSSDITISTVLWLSQIQ